MAASGEGVPAPRMARVKDATATTKARVHDIGGRSWRFGPNTGEPSDFIEMPLDVAMKVSHIPTFIVLGPDGERYQPAAARAERENPPGPVAAAPPLRNDQVVATLDELTIQALRTRASAWNGHEDYDPKGDRAETAKFIMDRQAEAPALSEDGEADLADGELLGDDEGSRAAASLLGPVRMPSPSQDEMMALARARGA